MRELTQEEIQILHLHAKWLADEVEGKRANLSEVNLYEANLSEANLSEANLYEANLSRTNLSRTNLSEANLSGANLYKANLREANLYRTNLSKVNLSEADLSGANLSEANLYEANLSRADLNEANLRSAKNIVTFGPIGSRGEFTYAVRHTDRIMVKCGCFWGDFEHWQAKCRAIHKDTPHGRAYAAAAEFIRAYAAAYWQD